jgi:hypothetical protein
MLKLNKLHVSFWVQLLGYTTGRKEGAGGGGGGESSPPPLNPPNHWYKQDSIPDFQYDNKRLYQLAYFQSKNSLHVIHYLFIYFFFLIT